jgi:hypothetical protein
MGRPTKLTRDLANGIVTRLRLTMPRVFAAESMGIHRDSFHAWMAHGLAASACTTEGCTSEHHGPGLGLDASDADIAQRVTYSDFSDMVMRAEAEAVQLATTNWVAAFPEDWRAAREWLQSRYPREYPKGHVQLTGPGGGPIEVEISALDTLKGKIDTIAKRLLSDVAVPTEAAIRHNGGDE